MIYVIATIEIAPNRRDDFLQIFQDNVPAVLAEDGCIEYVPTIDLQTAIPAQGDARPDVVTVVEKWADVEAHLIAPHMLAYRAKVKDLVTRVELQVVEPA